MKLHSHPFSQHSRRVLMLCDELGISPDIAVVDFETGAHKAAPFLAPNPDGQVPVLEDGDLVLPQSHAIMKCLAGAHGGTAHYPENATARAHVDAWLDWVHCQLNPPVQTIAIQTMRMGENAVAALVAASRERVATALGVLELGLAQKRGIGGDVTLANLAVASDVALFEMCGGDLAEYPVCAAWFETMKARPSFAATAPQKG